MGRTSRTRLNFLAGGAAAATFGVVRAPARAAQFEMKFATDLPESHPAVGRARSMWAAIEQETGGRVHTGIFPNSQLGDSLGMFSQLRVGAINFLTMSAGQLASVVPAADICYLGFAYKDQDEGLKCMDGALGNYIRREVEAKGMHALHSCWDSGMLDITSSSHPIRTPDDLRGFKVRVIQSRIEVDMFKALGAIPAALSLSEIYPAMQTKLVDGTATPLVTIESGKLYEVQKYISLTNHVWSGPWMVANSDTWKSLPADVQETIERNNTKYALLERKDAKEMNVAAAGRIAKFGLLLNDVDQAPFRARLKSYFQYWAGEFGSTQWGLLQSSLSHRLI